MSYIVENGRLMQLAVTGVQQFNPAEEGCPTRWFFKNVQGRKEPARVWHTEGDDVQAQLDHYLATGEDVLGKIARPAKTKNLLPAPGPDLIIDLGLNNERRPPPKNGRKVSYFPREQSLLHAAGIPFIGFLDLVNPRGVTVGEEGEPITDGLPEVIDHKTTKSFKWAKTKEQLLESTQMNGYGVFVLDQTGADAVRLSHNAYLTDPALKADARKATIVVSAAAVRERWTRVVEPIVERMKSVAAATREQDVPGNLGACESFGGCPHKTYCPTYNQQNALKRISMGLLQNRKPAAAVPAPNGAAAPQVPAPPGNMPWVQPTGAPQPPPQAYAAPAQQPAPVHQFMPQAAPVAPQYAAPPAAPPPPPAPPAPVAAAPTGAPLIRDVIAAGAAVQGQKYLVREVPTMYLCSTGGKQSFIPLIGGQPILTEYTEGIVALPADYAIVQAPPPQAPAAAPPAPPPPPAPMQTAPPPPPAPQASSTPPPPPAAPATATRKPRAPRAAAAPTNGSVFALFVNAIPNGGFTDLSGYVYEAVAEMQEQFQVADIRVAPSDGPLGFSKWKGVLAGMVRAQPPPPGTYVAFTKGNELTEIVVEALVPLCGAGALVRGV